MIRSAAVIGIGEMGAPIARRIRQCGLRADRLRPG